MAGMLYVCENLFGMGNTGKLFGMGDFSVFFGDVLKYGLSMQPIRSFTNKSFWSNFHPRLNSSNP